MSPGRVRLLNTDEKWQLYKEALALWFCSIQYIYIFVKDVLDPKDFMLAHSIATQLFR